MWEHASLRNNVLGQGRWGGNVQCAVSCLQDFVEDTIFMTESRCRRKLVLKSGDAAIESESNRFDAMSACVGAGWVVPSGA